jgi:hypothetical protein
LFGVAAGFIVDTAAPAVGEVIVVASMEFLLYRPSPFGWLKATAATGSAAAEKWL